jgi:hypothetical protein
MPSMQFFTLLKELPDWLTQWLAHAVPSSFYYEAVLFTHVVLRLRQVNNGTRSISHSWIPFPNNSARKVNFVNEIHCCKLFLLRVTIYDYEAKAADPRFFKYEEIVNTKKWKVASIFPPDPLTLSTTKIFSFRQLLEHKYVTYILDRIGIYLFKT